MPATPPAAAADGIAKEQVPPCPVCGGTSAYLDTVDFNKSCEELHGRALPPAGLPCEYRLCSSCGFCFAPAFSAWSRDEFMQRIYNDDYLGVDPEYAGARPRANAASLQSIFGERARGIRHLDYGGGNGLLSRLLGEAGWNSRSFDPFADPHATITEAGRFDLITAFEVFEHVPDPQQLMANFGTLIAADGVVMFSTLLSDGHLQAGSKLTWWYASPRNGHISLFTRQSLKTLARNNGVHFASFSAGFHAFFTQVPPWATHIFRTEAP
jgi:SAM-dependent methyltransferase